jgi:prepilin-type processing-associated H-X9-DG protein
MNAIFGRFSISFDPNVDPTVRGVNVFFTQYRQYLKLTQVPRPAKTWLFIDEQPDSINDGYFVTDVTANNWQDLPASYHNRACGFSFADGHSEIKKWRSSSSVYPAGKFVYPAQKPFDALGRLDIAWYAERTGYTLTSGQGQFGY